MIEGRSIICFAHDWKGDPTSKTHIMRILSEKNRILWVNSIGMRRPTASGPIGSTRGFSRDRSGASSRDSASRNQFCGPLCRT